MIPGDVNNHIPFPGQAAKAKNLSGVFCFLLPDKKVFENMVRLGDILNRHD